MELFPGITETFIKNILFFLESSSDSSLHNLSMNSIHCTHQEGAFAFLLGADSLHTEIRSVENLGLSAIMIFT